MSAPCPRPPVLIAEDNPVNQLICTELLQQAGLQVELAGDGIEAVTLATLQPYALILMDVHMPGLDGLEATRLIRQLPAHQHTPILAMSGSCNGAELAEALASGMNGHLPKPFSAEELQATLARWLGPTTND
ncbi:MAG: hypothetical protein RJA44_267 [Pseudomonadota bacterium]|jgi:CheY-like chemotaxis protein